MIAAITQNADSLASAIPTFTDRLNFVLPLVVVLVIVMFFLLLKSYTSEISAEDRNAPPDRPDKRR